MEQRVVGYSGGSNVLKSIEKQLEFSVPWVSAVEGVQGSTAWIQLYCCRVCLQVTEQLSKTPHLDCLFTKMVQEEGQHLIAPQRFQQTCRFKKLNVNMFPQLHIGFLKSPFLTLHILRLKLTRCWQRGRNSTICKHTQVCQT